jgi:hypothetical protein
LKRLLKNLSVFIYSIHLNQLPISYICKNKCTSKEENTFSLLLVPFSKKTMREDYLKGDNENQTNIEKEIERALRPLSFEDFTGQDKILENLKIFVLAAKQRKEPRTSARSSGLRKNHFVEYRGCRIRDKYQNNVWSCTRKTKRFGWTFDQSRPL